MRPWNVRDCGICGTRKVWVGDPNSTGVRRRVCPNCDQKDRVLALIDTELVRLGDGARTERLEWWQFMQRRWQDGVITARGVAEGHLREIRDAYIADALTRESETLGLYDEPTGGTGDG